MANTEYPSVLTAYIKALITAHKSDSGIGMQDVFLGDQVLIPRTPACCVEPASETRELAGAPFRTENVFQCPIIVYHFKVQDIQANVLESMQTSEKIMDLLHTDKTMGGLVIHGWVESLEPGFANRSESLMRATRLMWRGISKTNIA